MSDLANIAIGLIVVGLLLVRQLQPRPAKETSSIRLALILAAAGIAEITKTTGTRHLTTAAVAWLAVSLMAGAGLGAIRAATVRIWRAQDGSAWRQGTMLTAALWLISLAAHLALDTIIDHTSQFAALGTSSILFYLAVTAASVSNRAAVTASRDSGGMGTKAHSDRFPAVVMTVKMIRSSPSR